MIRGIKPVHGVGINDADYNTNYPVRCKYYSKWTDMLMRCYSKHYQAKNPRYIGCTVCNDWLIFSNFKMWMETQDWIGKELDKDLLGDGRIYSPETCCFISRAVNAFLVQRGSGLTGVCWHKDAKKFQSNCRNPFTKKQENLGLYLTDIEAHNAWLARKNEHAISLAAKESDSKIKNALLSRYAQQ